MSYEVVGVIADEAARDATDLIMEAIARQVVESDRKTGRIT